MSDDIFTLKAETRARIIIYFNGLTAGVMASYPDAESKSWDIQKAEAEAFIAAGLEATLALTPFVKDVCLYQYGPSDEISTLQQVREKCLVIKAHADNWAQAAAFVNGCRARKDEELAIASTKEELEAISMATMQEVDAFRTAAGL